MTLERKWSLESMQHPVLAASVLEKETISTPHVSILATPFHPNLIYQKNIQVWKTMAYWGEKKCWHLSHFALVIHILVLHCKVI